MSATETSLNPRDPSGKPHAWTRRGDASAPAAGVALVQLFPRAGEPLVLAAREQPYLLGRDEGCDVVVASANVSRRHAELTVLAAAPWAVLMNLGARNGTYVNRVPVAKARALETGDILELGDASARFERVTSELPASTRGGGTTPNMLVRPILTEGLVGDLALYPVGQLLLNLTKVQATGTLLVDVGGLSYRLAFRNGNAADRRLFDRVADLTAGKFCFEPSVLPAVRA